MYRNTHRPQHEINHSVETVSPKRLLFQYMKSLSKSDKIKAFIAPKMTYLIKLIDNNRKCFIYIEGNIRGIYHYLEMIGDTRTLTTSDQRSHIFGLWYSINNDTTYLHPVIADLCMTQKSVCECCGRIVNKADACTTHSPKLIPPSLKIKMN